MSIYQKASLVQIPSGYKAADDKLYSVVPNNGDGDFTIDSDADATRVNKDGLIESVVADQARLNYDPTNPQDPHLLLEPSRTNFVSPNNSLTGYTLNGVSTTNNDAIAPNGTNEGAKVQATTSGTAVVFKGFSTTSSNATHNFSVFVKAGTHNILQIQEGFAGANIIVDLSDGTEVSSQNATNKKIEEYPNGWYRVSFNFTSNGTNLQFSIYFSGSYSSGDNYYAWGGQIETGSYATSLIPTSGSAVTRTADSCEKTSVASGIINQTEGVIFLDFENYGQIGTSYGNHFKIESAGNNDRVAIQSDAAALNRLIFVINDGSSTFFQPREDISLGRNKIAIKYKSGDIDVFLNGTKIESSTSSFTFTNTLNKIYIGQPNKLYQAMVFNEALSDSELQTLTS
jgi:hypothetical protein